MGLNYIKQEISIPFLTIVLLVLSASLSFAQPGDKSFSVVTFGNHGFAECSYDYYKIYSCTVDYPNSSNHSVSFQETWRPDFSSLKIVDTLTCVPNAIEATRLPFEASYFGKSCLNTNVLMVIRAHKDTMFINAGGSDPYLWALDPDGFDMGLPFIFYFQKGFFDLEELHSERGRSALHYSTYRDYLINYYQHTTPAYNPSKSKITSLEMNQDRYKTNDIIKIALTGTVLLDGGCGGGNIIWTLQKQDGEKWLIQKDLCCTQMDCGIGSSVFKNITVPIFIYEDKPNPNLATYPSQLAIAKGNYRLIVYDDYHKPYWSNEFILE